MNAICVTVNQGVTNASNVTNAFLERDKSLKTMPTASDLLDGIEKEHIVGLALNWLGMRYFGLMDSLTIAGKEVHTYIDEVAIALAIIMAVNLTIVIGTDLYSIYQSRKNRKPTWETYNPQTTDLREVYEDNIPDIRRSYDLGKGYRAREVKTDEGLEVEILKE